MLALKVAIFNKKENEMDLSALAFVVGIGTVSQTDWNRGANDYLAKVAVEYSLYDDQRTNIYLNLEHISDPTTQEDRGVDSIGIEMRVNFK